MSRLGEKDRDAVMLRFFKEKSVREVAGLESQRGGRAKTYPARTGKTAEIFHKRGVSSTTAIIAGAISANSVQAAPVGAGKIGTAVAIAKGAAASASTLTLIKGALKIMAWTNANSNRHRRAISLSRHLARRSRSIPSASSIHDNRTFSFRRVLRHCCYDNQSAFSWWVLWRVSIYRRFAPSCNILQEKRQIINN